MRLTKRAEYLQQEEARLRGLGLSALPVPKEKKKTKFDAITQAGARKVVEALSVTPNRIVSFRRNVEGFQQSRAHKANEVNLQRTAHEGQVSDKASQRIEQAVQWLVAMAKVKRIFVRELDRSVTFRVNFITLTLSGVQAHSDTWIVDNMLSSWLDWLRYHTGCTRYVWKAEKQANGNIHFHIVTDVFLHYAELRQAWNRIQQKHGYTASYYKANFHHNPPSTEVKSVKHIKRIANYLAKYMSKNRSWECVGEMRKLKDEVFEVLYNSPEYYNEEGGRKRGKVIGHILGRRLQPVTCRLWFLSRELSRCRPVVVDETDLMWEPLNVAMQTTAYHTYYTDYCTLYYANFSDAWTKSETGWSRHWNNILAERKGESVRVLAPVTEF